jgi:hypothetical protein
LEGDAGERRAGRAQERRVASRDLDRTTFQ